MSFIDQLAEKVAPLEKASNLAMWNLLVTGDKRYADEFKNAKVALKKVFSSKADFETLKQIEGRDREKKLLLQSFIPNQIPLELIEKIATLESEVEAIYTNFRPIVDGKEISNNDLKEILFTSDDGIEREKIWMASKEIGEKVEKQVLELVKLRNQAAEAVGFPDYYTMGLELQELNQKSLFDLLSDLKNKTDPLWEKYTGELFKDRKSRFQTKTIYPWHLDDLFFQEAPKSKIDFDAFYTGKDIVEISKKFYAHIGMPVEDVLERSDLFERENKCQHAFCFCMDRGNDVRILCNIRPDEYWMCTQLHELGHAVYDKYIDPKLPYFLRTTAHTSTTEAIAMIFGRLSKDPKFIDRYVQKRETVETNIHENLLVFSRWILVMAHFERDLYQSRSSDLNRQWWSYVEDFQGITPPPDRSKPDWAAKLHLACAPVYYQNYLLGEMTASQLKASIKDLLSPDAGRYLRERLFMLGASYPWDETIERVTGEPLNPDYFVEDLIRKCDFVNDMDNAV